MRDFAKDLRWGAGWGLFGGVIYMLFAAVVVVGIKGGMSDAPAGVTWLTLLGIYPVAGIAAGLITGLLRPWLKTRRKSMVVGMVAAFLPTMGFLRLAEGPIFDWGGAEWFGAIAGAILLGGMAAYIWWGQLHDFDPYGALGEEDDTLNGNRGKR